jgi:hypothetical protein
MPRPSNPAARLVLDGQRTWVANQSIGGQIHAAPRWPRHSRILRQEPVLPSVDGLRFAIFYTKLHDRLPRPLLATSHQRHHGRGKELQTTDNHITESLNQAPASYRTPPENSRQLSKPVAPVTNSVPTVRYSAARTPDLLRALGGRLTRGSANPASAEDISSVATLVPWLPGAKA